MKQQSEGIRCFVQEVGRGVKRHTHACVVDARQEVMKKRKEERRGTAKRNLAAGHTHTHMHTPSNGLVSNCWIKNLSDFQPLCFVSERQLREQTAAEIHPSIPRLTHGYAKNRKKTKQKSKKQRTLPSSFSFQSVFFFCCRLFVRQKGSDLFLTRLVSCRAAPSGLYTTEVISESWIFIFAVFHCNHNATASVHRGLWGEPSTLLLHISERSLWTIILLYP